MKPIKLTFSGLYSYQESVTIDFEKLSRDGIFGIFGSVGSGKSSILEAISYALYGKTERMNSQDSMGYNMMNLKSDRMSIDFVFSHAEKHYRFEATARRNGKQFDQIVKEKGAGRKAFELIGEEEIPLDSADAGLILGLNYDQFKKIVVIPQGKFHEFIHLTPNDRTHMLSQLFPLNQYNLWDQLGVKTKENESQANQTEGELKGFLHVTKESEAQLNEELEKVALAEKTLGVELKSVELVHDKWKSIREFQQSLRSKEKELEGLKQKEEELKPSLPGLQLYQQISVLAEKELVEWKMRFGQLEQTKLQCDKEQSGFQKRQTEFGQEQQEKEKVFAQFTLEELPLKEALLKAYKDKQTWETKLKELAEAKASLAKKIELSEELLKKEEGKKGELKANIASQEKEIELLEKEREKAHLLDRGVRLNKELELGKTELQNCLSIQERLREERKQVIADFNKRNPNVLQENPEKIAELIGHVTDRGVDLGKEVKKAKDEASKLKASEVLNHFAQQLNHGENCPLCGATEHPQPFDIGDQLVRVKEVEKQVGELENTVHNLRVLLVELNGLKERFVQVFKEQKERERNLEPVRGNWEAWKKESGLEGVNESDLVQTKKAIPTYTEKSQELKNLRKQLEELNERSTQKGHHDLLQKRVELEAEERQLTTLIKEVQNKLGGEKMDAGFLEAIQNALHWKEHKLERYNALSLELEKAKVKLDALVVQLESEKRVVEGLEKKVLGSLKELGVTEMIQASQVMEEKQKWLALEKEVDLIQNAKGIFEKQIAEAKEKLGKMDIPEEEYDQVEERLKRIREEHGTKQTELGIKRDEKVKYLKAKERKEELEKLKSQLEREKEIIKVMRKLFSKNGFSNFVSRIYLEQLCALANQRFIGFTQNQLKLEMDEAGNFVVRDFLNGGQIRNIKTLSGGQTFQAALCLALALSEQLQLTQETKQSFFFMDEGFGSLDKDSLATVFESLKALRKESRTVGIISHVELLKQEIDQYIEVRKSETRGSEIELVA